MRISFNNIVIRPKTFDIFKNNESIDIEPKVFDLILYLINNRDKVVSRDDLLNHIWNGVIVSDTSLTNRIKSARTILDDDGQEQHTIKTVHGRGYQFIQEIQLLEDEKLEQPIKTSNLPLYILLIAGLFTAYLLNSLISFEQKPPNKISLAVLAFADLSIDKDQAYFSDGMSTELTGLFAKMLDIKVRDRRSSFYYKGKNIDIKQIAKELNVSHIIDGSVRKEGDNLRIDIQLINANTGLHLWTQTFDGKIDDVLNLQAEIAQQVRSQFLLTVKKPIEKTRLINKNAYSLYLQSEFLNFKNDPDLILDAIDLVKKSITIDPEFVQAHLLLAQELISASLNYQKLAYDEGLKQARIVIERTLELNNQSAPAYAMLARLDLSQNSDFKSANENIDRALELDSNNTSVLANANVIYGYSGNLDGIVENHNKLIESNPKEFVYYRNKGIVQHWLGDLSGAVESFKKYKYYYNKAPIGNAQLTKVYIDLEKFDDALILTLRHNTANSV